MHWQMRPTPSSTRGQFSCSQGASIGQFAGGKFARDRPPSKSTSETRAKTSLSTLVNDRSKRMMTPARRKISSHSFWPE